ncbi:PA3715 family protein [Nonlabens marinus]|uniref:TonB-dependent receptor n=1 Tax=Nonlabens marinus S1-08 TaxID=1454201 RepID=W8W022_9FLAO|nr:hypothetical protein [Nonlabens marinus]BAO55571.1 TonB-dependent receptor [Nonlabens marinus S1-08]
MKFLLFITILLFASTASAQMSSSELLEEVLNQLEIKVENVEMRFLSEMVISDSEAILVFPEIAEQGEQYAIYHSHVLIVDRNDGSIKSRFSRKEEWFSDAIGIEAIEILFEPYQISNEYKVFGILIDYYVQSRANPYSSKNLSLFIIKEDTLERVLNDYIIYQYRGETNGTGDGEFEEIIGAIETIKSNQTLDNLQIIKTMRKIEFVDGVEEVTETSESTEVLTFKNGQYVQSN